MKLAHTADDGLAALLVGVNREGRILLGQLGETVGELVEILLGLGLYGDTDHRIGEVHRLQYDGSVLIAESIARAHILEAYACTYITGGDNVDGILVVGVHLEEA